MKLEHAAHLGALMMVAIPALAVAQRTTPAAAQAEKLAYLAGTWHGGSGGESWVWHVTRGPAGAFHGQAEGVESDGTAFQIDEILAFDGVKGEYVWVRFPSGGAAERGRGWLKGNTWTFLFDDSMQDGRAARVRCTITMVRPDYQTIRWERSIEGGDWEVTYDGTATKAP